MKPLQVAAAVIRGGDGRVLIARRADDRHQGGLWEFPGGKLEPGETVYAALQRELAEELGIQVRQARPLIRVHHQYPDRQVLLDVWEVSDFSGAPHGAEGQPLAWVAADQLAGYSFPVANLPIVSAARLPERYLITPPGLADDTLLQGLERAIASGIRLIQLRVPSLGEAAYQRLAQRVQEVCAGRAELLLKGPAQWLREFPGAGWHLTAAQLRQYAPAGQPLRCGGWLAASCHDAEELQLAAWLGVDFVTLSPLLRTKTHPQVSPLGWARATDLLEQFNQPAYLLGGLGPADLERAWQAGAQGVAAIGALWPEVPAAR